MLPAKRNAGRSARPAGMHSDKALSRSTCSGSPRLGLGLTDLDRTLPSVDPQRPRLVVVDLPEASSPFSSPTSKVDRPRPVARDAYSGALDAPPAGPEAVGERGGHEIDAGPTSSSRPSRTRTRPSAPPSRLSRPCAGRLAAERGPRVRMGIHAGEAEACETGYVGLEVHRAARVCAAPWAGRSPLSSARTREGATGAVSSSRTSASIACPGFRPKADLSSAPRGSSGELHAPGANGSPKGVVMRVVIADDSVLLRRGS